jgi:hypothetical protein
LIQLQIEASQAGVQSVEVSTLDGRDATLTVLQELLPAVGVLDRAIRGLRRRDTGRDV